MNAAIPNYPKRKSKREALLDLLSDGRKHHMREMAAVGGMRFGARVWELIHDHGYDIETLHIGADETCYVMHLKPKQMALI